MVTSSRAFACFSIALISTLAGVLMANEPAGFIAALPDQIRWVESPQVPGMQSAVLFGAPAKPGPYVIRARLPPNVQVEPHTHREDRTYTILAGEWKIGFGEKFDAEKLKAFPPGALYRLPAGVAHFQAAGPQGATIQIEAIGPSSIDFLNPDKKYSLPGKVNEPK